MRSYIQNYLQKRFANWLIKGVFNTLEEEDVLRTNSSGELTFKGKVLTKEQQEVIKEDAIRFQNSQIWFFLRQEIKFQVGQSAILKSKTPEDMVASKIAMYLLTVITNKINTLSK